MSSQTLHVVSLPHTQTTAAYATCAYTQKVRKFCKMMTGRQRKVILYAGEENDAPCDEHVVCVPAARRRDHFGDHDEADLARGGMDWSPSSAWWREMNTSAAAAIRERSQPTDLLLLIMGQSQQFIADACPALTVAEWGVGYEGILNVGESRRNGGPTYCAFESYAHMHQVYRRWNLHNAMNTRWFDCVIPNFFDVDEFPPPDRAAKRRAKAKGDYLLFMGRLIENKGPHVAAQISEAIGMPLLVAGSGAIESGPGFVRSAEIEVKASGLEFLGPVGIRDRAELMAGAAAVLMPTLYTEPFGGVAVEAMFAGAPAITTDWGAFTETVEPGITGYRFRTIDDAVKAVQLARGMDRESIRKRAVSLYSLEAVAPLFERWFDRLDSLWDTGWDHVSVRGAA